MIAKRRVKEELSTIAELQGKEKETKNSVTAIGCPDHRPLS